MSIRSGGVRRGWLEGRGWIGASERVMSSVVVHSARPTPLPALLNPGHLVGSLWRHRDLAWQFAVRYFQARYKGTYLGIGWALAVPLLMLAVYTLVFNFIFQARLGVSPEETRSQYAVLLFCGITVYGIFSETVTRSTSLVLDNPNYVKKVVFPLEILAVSSLVSAVMFSGFGIALVLLGTWWFFGSVPWTAVLLPLVLVPMLALSLGLSWFFSSLAVFVRDVGNVVSIFVSQLLFFLTPIFYRVESLPVEWQWVARVNPMTPVVEGARNVLVLGKGPDWQALGLTLALGLLVMQFGYAWFVKSKRGFSDVL